ncbi:amine oxidase, flavin-containing superfamily [Aspergillus lucknowensis]|uniref:Amine oxidase domain-containing protein n=1 Tax=Aspergillus lucknowensis TaxID=176173 RepID=A0ABR4LDP8_9EURO
MFFPVDPTRLVLVVSIWLGLAFSLPSFGPNLDDDTESTFGKEPSDAITRDVCVIGGGAAGTYAAIRLRELGRSVVLVEREEQLGGHTRTYYDPEGRPIDYGVWVYQNNTEASNFFAHFNIPLTGQDFSRISEGSQRIDLRTGQRVPPPSGNVTDAMMRYVQILLQYPYLSDGWDLPDPVPEDLVLSFREFIEKHDLGAAVETITLYVQGLGDILSYPMVYIMKYFSFGVALGVQSGFSTSASRANGELFQAARNELGDDVLLSATVAGMERSDSGARILVATPSGDVLIEADKLIIAIPPLLKQLENFDLNDQERELFGQFGNSYYYTTVLNLSGVPNEVQILNRGADTPYNIPVMPGTYVFYPSQIQTLFTGFFGGGSQNMTEDEVIQTIKDNALQLRNAGFDVADPEILAYGNHSPFNLFVPAEAIARGFYRNLYSLQGNRRTYYTGAAWHAHDSAALWKFTERLLNERVFVD